MANEANEHTFTLNEIGEDTGEKFVGDFKCKKRLSHRDQLRKDQVRRDLLGGQPGVPTERALSTSMIISELAVRVLKAPKWWAEVGEGLDLMDDNIIGLIHDMALKPENDAAKAKVLAAKKAQDEMRKEAADEKTEDEAAPDEEK